MSRNHPDVYLRVANSIRHYGLDISRAMLNGGEPLDRLLKAYKIDLFLSASEEDVASALRCGIAAGRIYSPPGEEPPPPTRFVSPSMAIACFSATKPRKSIRVPVVSLLFTSTSALRRKFRFRMALSPNCCAPSHRCKVRIPGSHRFELDW